MKAYRLILLFGCISLFADIAYEGARSITGPYLSILGATSLIVGLASGLGEFAGYTLRMVSGYYADQSRRYWTFVTIGYALNLLSIPLLALAQSWELAFFLLLLERIGKAIRTPARDALLSFATKDVGRGWGFGIHKALDQIGAFIGPIFMAFILNYTSSYRLGFAWLFFPALVALLVLAFTRAIFPQPELLEMPLVKEKATYTFPKRFWIYVIGVAFVAAGMVDFPLIAYHYQKTALFSPAVIPLTYALAMGTEGISGLLLGPLFDRFGMKVLVYAVILVAFFPFFVFTANSSLVLLGTLLWGIGMGTQETLVRAYLATIIPPAQRATAYGLLSMGFGVAWLLGSVLIGWLYDQTIWGTMLASFLLQLASLPFFLALNKPKA